MGGFHTQGNRVMAGLHVREEDDWGVSFKQEVRETPQVRAGENEKYQMETGAFLVIFLKWYIFSPKGNQIFANISFIWLIFIPKRLIFSQGQHKNYFLVHFQAIIYSEN